MKTKQGSSSERNHYLVGSCYLASILVGGCRCAMLKFDLGSARMFSTTTFETDLPYHKAIWSAATHMYVYLIVLSPLTALVQLINGSIYKF